MAKVPENLDPQAAQTIGAELQRNMGVLRWLRDCVGQLHEENYPALREVLIDVAMVLALVPPLTLAMGRVGKALVGQARPAPKTRTRKT